jgi:outer membrane protein OmpA-like peptidoglycan-associated protein
MNKNLRILVVGLAVASSISAHSTSIPMMDLDLYFEENSAVLSPEQVSAVASLACHTLAKVDGKVTLDGHSSRGEGRPESLAQRRLEVVRSALLANGVSSRRVTAVSHGSHLPITYEPGARAKNRRVEVSGGRFGPSLSNCGLWDWNELRQTR